MLSIIITAWEEPNSTKECLERFLEQKTSEKYEVWVTCPDEPTKKVVMEYKKKYPNVINFLHQPREVGKNSILNLLFEKARGNIIIMTDGDVFVEEGCINEICKCFDDSNVGAVSGRPLPTNPRNDMLGYWSHLLTYGAHEIRKKLFSEGKFIECSGYVWAIRRGIIKEMPLDVAEDSITPYLIWKKGYKIAYAPNAIAYTKFPTNIKDWINQKIRTAKAHEKINFYMNDDKKIKVKSFSNEALYGLKLAFSFANSPKEFFWTLLLLPFRLYVWVIYFYETKMLKTHYGDIWTRVKSTRALD
ncbi:glycosyltransferase family 2 protein [Candidatus Woesearchaeota archaeon]|nr:glycosyltransferase family 2 protein [Candidatus Woesearchaeota archaeon]